MFTENKAIICLACAPIDMGIGECKMLNKTFSVFLELCDEILKAGDDRLVLKLDSIFFLGVAPWL